MATSWLLSGLWLLIISQFSHAQMIVPQVKIFDELFPVSASQQVSQITWRILGRTSSEKIYCVSEAPVSQLRFVCLDCAQKNITDMVNVLNSAQDLTRNAGFPAVSLKNIDVNPSWTGATIMCQAALNGGTIDSAPVTVNVEYLRNVHVTDANYQSPMRIMNQGNLFYVECNRGPDGLCQQTGRRKTLRCAVQANPAPTSYRWLKNGEVASGNGAEITIGTEWIGKSIQCSANNGLYQPDEMPTSQAVSIEPYSAARLIQTNFRTLQSSAPFTVGNRIEMNQAIKLGCLVEGNPRPVVFWRMRQSNGQIVNAPCPQGYDGQLQDVTGVIPQVANTNNLVRMQATCELHISNYSYSGLYWCSACSVVSLGSPECSPALDVPGDDGLNILVQGPPMQAEMPPSVEQIGTNTAVVTVHYCAEPMPKPPRDIVFSVDNNDIQVGSTWQNFRFDSTELNTTLPNCYSARLQISPVHDGDKNRQIVLKVTNPYGQKQIDVSLADLLGDGTSTGSIATIIIASVLGFIAFCVLLVGIIIFCIRRQLFCFSGMKDGQYGNPTNNLKTTIGSPEVYTDNINNSHGYYNDRNLEKRPEQLKASHEGLNYAELDLTDRRTPSAAIASTSLQPPINRYPLRETTIASTISVNSVV